MASIAYCASNDIVSKKLQQVRGLCVIEVEEEWTAEALSNCEGIKQDIGHTLLPPRISV